MSELQLIESTLARTARRQRLARAGRGFWAGLLVGASVWLLTLAVFKLLPIPPASLWIAGLTALTCALVGGIIGGWRKNSLAETARWVDVQQKFHERLSTALEVARLPAASDWKQLVVTDAANRVKEIDPRRLLPFRFPRVARWTVLVLVAGLGLGFVPEYRSNNYTQKKTDEEVIKDTGRELVDLMRRSLDQRKPALEPTEKALEKVAELGDLLGKQPLTKSEALRDLASLTDKLAEQQQKLEKEPLLKPLQRAAREAASSSSPSPAELKKQMEDLQKALGDAAGDPKKLDQLKDKLNDLQKQAANMAKTGANGDAASQEKLSEMLSQMAREAREAGASLPDLEKAITALEAGQADQFLKDLDAAMKDLDKLRDLSKAMQALKQQAEKLGKDLAEQLKKGQAEAAQQTLEKMIEQLKSAELSREQLQKLLDEVNQAVDPASEYGKVAEHLKDAVKQMQQGQKPDAAQSLAEAAKELERLMAQMGDAKDLQAALDALQKAQACIGSSQKWGQCKGRPGYKPGGKPGRGVGDWSDDQVGWLQVRMDDELVDNSGVERADKEAKGVTDRGDAEINPKLDPTKVQGKMSPGDSMPSITIKGLSIKGESKISYEEAVRAAQKEAQSALNQDQVPRAYQNAVRDYFDDTKK